MRRLAFIIPTMNLLHFTKQAVLSIFLRPGDHIFVMDNGSSDGTLEWLEQQRRGGLSLSVTAFGKNLGVAAAWNRGLEEAFEAGHLRAIVMNNDVVLAADTVPALERGHNKYLGIVSTHSVASINALYQLERKPTYGLPVDYSCFMLSRAIYAKVGPFDEGYMPAYFEDQDFDCRAEQLGVPRGHLGDAVVCHYVSQTLHSGQLPDHNEAFRRNQQRFMERWGDYIRGGRRASRV